MADRKLRVAELFYSIQGEGSTMGKPAVFLRLTGCNLMCGGRGTENDKKLHDGATWRCDTIEVWLKGKTHDPQLYALKLADEYRQEFNAGAHLIITGGEPMLQQNQLVAFLNMFQKQFQNHIYIEIETNGTIQPISSFLPLIDQFNVSPKLSNSGMPKSARLKHDVLHSFSLLSKKPGKIKTIFKFVITDEGDMMEIINLIERFEIRSKYIWLMPGCSNREQFEKVAPIIADACKKYGFHFSSRLQINLWNEVTGV